MPTLPPLRSLGTGLRGFLRGFAYPVRGLTFLLRHRAAWPYALLPALVNGVLMLALAAFAITRFDGLLAWMRPDFLASVPTEAAWYGDLARAVGGSLVWLLSFVLATAGVVLGGLLGGAVFAGPFQEKLSEVIEGLALQRPMPDEPLNLRTLSKDAARGVSSALQRLALFGVVYIPLLLFSLIPVLGLLGVAATALYSMFFIALTFSDPFLERRRLPLRAKIAAARGVLAPFIGFGAALLLLALVPLLGFVLTPAFVTAGTLLWLDLAPPDDAPPKPAPSP